MIIIVMKHMNVSDVIKKSMIATSISDSNSTNKQEVSLMRANKY